LTARFARNGRANHFRALHLPTQLLRAGAAQLCPLPSPVTGLSARASAQVKRLAGHGYLVSGGGVAPMAEAIVGGLLSAPPAPTPPPPPPSTTPAMGAHEAGCAGAVPVPRFAGPSAAGSSVAGSAGPRSTGSFPPPLPLPSAQHLSWPLPPRPLPPLDAHLETVKTDLSRRAAALASALRRHGFEVT